MSADDGRDVDAILPDVLLTGAGFDIPLVGGQIQLEPVLKIHAFSPLLLQILPQSTWQNGI